MERFCVLIKNAYPLLHDDMKGRWSNRDRCDNRDIQIFFNLISLALAGIQNYFVDLPLLFSYLVQCLRGNCLLKADQLKK